MAACHRMVMLLLFLNSLKRKNQRDRVRTTRKCRHSTRIRQFRERQRRERLAFALFLATCSNILFGQAIAVERRTWAFERCTEWWDKIVLESWEDVDWLENFRMTKSSFQYICNQLRHKVQKQDTRLRPAISVERRVAITLWRLATNVEYRTVGHLFGVARSTVCSIVIETTTAIVEVLMPIFIRRPTGEALLDIVRGFNAKWGFPQCCGAVDGSHIPIIGPVEQRPDYYNRKGWYSVNMQGVVDHAYRFTDVCIGWPGSVHDARVFVQSNVYQLAEKGELFVPSNSTRINGVDVPYLLLGDAAYPMMSWLMKPFPDNGNLSQQQKHFNYRLSRARMVVENAFGRLKGRWRILLKRLDVSLENIPVVIGACCVLHNICENFGERFTDAWRIEVEELRNREPRCNLRDAENINAVNVRLALTDYFQEH